jgi:membrane protein involved in colicin uptake
VLNSLKEKEAVLIELYRDGRPRKFQLVPDRNDKMVWDVRRFSQKVENLKGNISDEAEQIYKDEIRKMQQSKETVLAEMQKQKQSSLLKIRDESRKLALELKRLQEEKNKLGTEARKKYAEELKRIQEELRKVQEKIKAEGEGSGEGKSGR